jgi:hypothetical protein
MTPHTAKFEFREPSLNSVAAGLELAQRVLEHVRAGQPTVIDFAHVDRMTPSYANALVMTLLEAVGPQVLPMQVALENVSPAVLASWASAVARYERGVRLSTQRSNAA